MEVVGDDAAGRKIIVISACRLPSNKNFDYTRYVKNIHWSLKVYFAEIFCLWPKISGFMVDSYKINKINHANLKHKKLNELLRF